MSPHSTLVNLFQQAGRFPAATALVESGGRAVTYSELWLGVLAYKQLLESKGVEEGDRVAIVLSNSAAYAMAYFGTLAARAVAVALNRDSKQHTLDSLIRHCGAKCVLTGDQPAPTHPSDFSLESFEAWLAPQERLAQILYTSGTTGDPKGVIDRKSVV